MTSRQGKKTQILLGLTLMLGGIVIVVVGRFRSRMSMRIIPILVGEFPGWSYRPAGDAELAKLAARYRLLPPDCDYDAGGLVEGIVSGGSFRICNIHATRDEGSWRRPRVSTVFRGYVMMGPAMPDRDGFRVKRPYQTQGSGWRVFGLSREGGVGSSIAGIVAVSV